VEATTEHRPVRGELLTAATPAANVGFDVGHGFVNSPPVTDHSAQDRADSHMRRVVPLVRDRYAAGAL
jgi:hypothetical protein